MKRLPERWFPALVVVILLVFFTALSLSSDGYFGGADNISHYHISHFAFKYPWLFLDAWGRPLYTLISAPFAQFGLQGAKLLNVLLGVATAWLAFRAAQRLRIRPALAALFFVCFTPLYFAMMPTALTEILFGFLMLLGIILFLKGKYISSAIVLSFLPFARTEGYLLIPVFLSAFLWTKQYRTIPFLGTGILLFTLAGGLYYGDPLWLINRFPYPVNYTHPVYHSTGSLWHFLELRHLILGLPLEILCIAGVAGMVRDLFSKDHEVKRNAWSLCMLFFVPFMAYFALHSILYWRALGGSMGLERVLAAALPLAAIIALKGMSDLSDLFRLPRIGPSRMRDGLRGGFLIIVTGTVVVTPFLIYKTPCPLSPEEETIRRATTWLKKSPYSGRLVFYTDNNVPYYLKADPFRKNPPECVLFGDYRFLDTIPQGSALVWDAHFGPNESKIPPDTLLADSRQRVIAYFRPTEPWITFGGGWYDCYITLTTPPGAASDNYAIRDSIEEGLDSLDIDRTLYLNTFENPGDVWDPSFLSSDPAHRGKYACIMDQRTEFSPGLTLPVSSLPLSGRRQEIRASLYIRLKEKRPDLNTLLVISFERENKSFGYTALNLNSGKTRPGKWDRITLSAPVPDSLQRDDLLKVYIWNPGKQVLCIDDLRADLVSTSAKLE